MEITPRVTYEGEVILELTLENSSLGQNVDVAGQSIPSFNSRKVATHLRLREGESNLLAGLIGEDERKSIQGLPGLIHVPGFKQALSGNDIDIKNTDIVMLITPHVVRTHELTSTDLGSIYIGTQQNVGLGGPPPLIAPQGETPGGAGSPPAAAAPTPSNQPSNIPPGGVPTPGGVPPTNVPTPPGTSPVPGMVTPVATSPVPGLPPPPPAAPPTTGEGGVPVAPSPNTPPPTTAGQPPVTPAPVAPAPGAAPPAGQTTGAVSPATPAQIIVSPPGTTFQVAGGPYTMPVSINNASRISVVTLTITYNPAVLRVRTVQDGTFMRQGGVTASFTPRIDAASGRVDIAVTRAGDQTGVSGAGLLAALIFDAVGPGNSVIAVNGVANTPEGTPVQLTFSPVTVMVR